MTGTDHLDHFLRAVHRRLLVLRALERGGACAAIACAVAATLTGAALWTGRDALRLSVVTVTLGAIAGIVWGFIRRPSMLHAAAEADRQLDLKDLLGTALAARDAADIDAWSRTVLALADARCRTLSPGSVVLNRYGARAWGGIGLAVAFVLTLGVLSTSPMRSDATGIDVTSSSLPPTARSADIRPPGESGEASFTSPRASAHPRPRDSDSEDSVLTSSNATTSNPDHRDAARIGADAQRDAANRSDRSNGTGAQSSDNADPGDRDAVRPAPAAGTPSTAGETAGGGGKTAKNQASDSDLDGGNAASGAAPTPSRSTPPWSSPTWNVRRDAALRAARDGRVPDGYRDVLREYFQPDEQ